MTTENFNEVNCPDCRGRGTVLVAKMYPSGHTEVLEDCEFCEGAGFFYEDEYIMMKLQGRV